jgi:hypothetical protein
MTDFDNDKLFGKNLTVYGETEMDENIQKYFSILINSLYARIQGNGEEEDLLLDCLDTIWDDLTPEQIEIVSKIIKEFKND